MTGNAGLQAYAGATGGCSLSDEIFFIRSVSELDQFELLTSFPLASLVPNSSKHTKELQDSIQQAVVMLHLDVYRYT